MLLQVTRQMKLLIKIPKVLWYIEYYPPYTLFLMASRKSVF